MIPSLYRLISLDIEFACGLEAAHMDRFLDTLNLMPDLRFFRLGLSAPPPDFEPISPCPACHSARVVSVPLETIIFLSEFSDTMHIMQHILPARDVRVYIQPFFTGTGTDEEVDRVLPSLSAILPTW